MPDRSAEACAVRGETDVKKTEIAAPRQISDRSLQVSKIYETYAPRLTASVRKLFGNGPPDPEDVTHQAFERLIARGELDKIKNIQAFMWRAARNIVADHRRSKDVRDKYDYEVEQIFFPFKDDVLTPEYVLDMREQLEAVKKIIREMPEKRRRALILHRVEGLSMAETARRMGTSRPTVAAHIAKAMTDLSVVFWDGAHGTRR